MSVVAGAAAARVAVALLDDLGEWALRLGVAALLLLLLPLGIIVLGFGGILALFGGLSGTSDGGGPVWGGPPTSIAVGQIPAEQAACDAAGRKVSSVHTSVDGARSHRQA